MFIDIRDKIIRDQHQKAMNGEAIMERIRGLAITGRIDGEAIRMAHKARLDTRNARFIIACFMPLPSLRLEDPNA